MKVKKEIDYVKVFKRALADALYYDDHCWVCGQHPSQHAKDCEFVEAQSLYCPQCGGKLENGWCPICQKKVRDMKNN
jgi:recombinational DNA repair protein RecR